MAYTEEDLIRLNSHYLHIKKVYHVTDEALQAREAGDVRVFRQNFFHLLAVASSLENEQDLKIYRICITHLLSLYPMPDFDKEELLEQLRGKQNGRFQWNTFLTDVIYEYGVILPSSLFFKSIPLEEFADYLYELLTLQHPDIRKKIDQLVNQGIQQGDRERVSPG